MRKRSLWIALFGAVASLFLAACSLLGLSEGLDQTRCMENSFCASLNDSFPTGDPCKLWQCIDGFCAIGGRDADGDGFAAAECDEPGGREPDCDDTLAGVSPGAQERCPAVDEDCDGSVNEGLYAFEDAIVEGLDTPEEHEEVSYTLRPGTLEVAVTWTDRNLPRVAILDSPRDTDPSHKQDVIPVAVRDDVPDDEAERGRLPSSRGSALAPLPNNEYAFAYIEASGGCQRPVVGLMRSTPEMVTLRGTAAERRMGYAMYVSAADFDRGLPDENGRGCLRDLCNPHVECRSGATPDLGVQCEGTTCIKQCLVATECNARPAVMCTEPDVGADCNADMVNDERCAVTTPVTTMCRSAAMTACEADARCDWLGGTNTCVAARVTDACSMRLSMATCALDPACTWRTTFCVLTSSVTACPMVAGAACDATSGCEWTGSPTPTCAGIGSCAERCICPGDAATCVDTTRRCFTPRSMDACDRNVQCNAALTETCVADQPTETDTAFHCNRPCATAADCETGEDCEMIDGALRCDPPDALFARMLSVGTVDRAVAVTYARDNATVARETCGEMSPTVGIYANFAFRSSTMSVREMQIMPDAAVKVGDTKDTAPAAVLGLPGYGFLIAFTDPMFNIVFKRVRVEGDGTTASPYAFTLVDEPVLTLETGFDAMGRFPRSEVRLALGPRDGDRQQIGVAWHEKCAINGDVRVQLIALDTATGTLSALTAEPLTVPSATRDGEQLPSIAYSEDMDAWIVTYEIDNQEVRAIRLFLTEGGNALEAIPEDPFRVLSAPMGSTISEPSFAYPIPGMASFGAVGHLFNTPDDMDQGFYGAEFNCVEPPAMMDAGTPAP